MDPWFIIGQKIKERNQQNQLQTTEDAYNGLLSSIEAYKAGDKDYAGQKLTQNLQDLGLLDKSRGWQPDDTSPDRIKLIEAATKNFNNGHYTAQELYDRLGHAINGDFGQKLSKNQRQALSTVQQAQQSKLAPQYLSALTSDPTTGQGVANRLSLVNKTDPSMMSQIGNIASLNTEALSDPAYAPYMSDIGSYVSQESPQLMSGPLSDQALTQKFATDAPAGSVAPLLSKDYLNQLKEAAKPDKNSPTTVVPLYDPKTGKTEYRLINKTSGEEIKTLGEQRPVAVNFNKPTPGEVDAAAFKVANGEISLSSIPARSVARMQVINKLASDPRYKDVKLNEVEANRRKSQDMSLIRSNALIDGIQKPMQNLYTEAVKLDRSGFLPAGKAEDAWDNAWNSPELSKYRIYHLDVVTETRRALTNVGTISDTQIKLQMKPLESARSPQAIKTALEGIDVMLQSRKAAQQAPAYPNAKPNMGGNKNTQNAPKTWQELKKMKGY